MKTPSLILALLIFLMPASSKAQATINIPLAKTSFGIGYGNSGPQEGAGSHTETVASAYSLQASQLNPVGATDGVYTLKFSVKSFFFNYPGYFEVVITMGPQTCTITGCAPVPCPITGCTAANPGSQEICSRDGWSESDYADVTISCPNPIYLVIDQSLSLPGVPPATQTSMLPITLTFFTPSWSVWYKDAFFTFTPKDQGTCVPFPNVYLACQP